MIVPSTEISKQPPNLMSKFKALPLDTHKLTFAKVLNEPASMKISLDTSQDYSHERS